MKYFGQSTFAFVDKSVVNYRKVEFGMEFAKGSICVWITSQHWFQNSLWNNYWMNNEYILVVNQANIFYRKRRLFWIQPQPPHTSNVVLANGDQPVRYIVSDLCRSLHHSTAKIGKIILQKAKAVFYCIEWYFVVLQGILCVLWHYLVSQGIVWHCSVVIFV